MEKVIMASLMALFQSGSITFVYYYVNKLKAKHKTVLFYSLFFIYFFVLSFLAMHSGLCAGGCLIG